MCRLHTAVWVECTASAVERAILETTDADRRDPRYLEALSVSKFYLDYADIREWFPSEDADVAITALPHMMQPSLWAVTVGYLDKSLPSELVSDLLAAATKPDACPSVASAAMMVLMPEVEGMTALTGVAPVTITPRMWKEASDEFIAAAKETHSPPLPR